MKNLIEILLIVETLNIEELKSLSAWVDFVLKKKENPES